MIPFREWFVYGVSALGLAPDAFWSLTFREWRWLAPRAEALGREGLSALIALYPDEVAETRSQAATPAPAARRPQPATLNARHD